jgi:Spy/CpxP family protein refolding chaperone
MKRLRRALALAVVAALLTSPFASFAQLAAPSTSGDQGQAGSGSDQGSNSHHHGRHHHHESQQQQGQ